MLDSIKQKVLKKYPKAVLKNVKYYFNETFCIIIAEGKVLGKGLDEKAAWEDVFSPEPKKYRL